MIRKTILKIIRFYQIISQSLGKNCRFWPSCSEYFYQSVDKYGPVFGSFKGIKRILRCYPWKSGGVDLP